MEKKNHQLNPVVKAGSYLFSNSFLYNGKPARKNRVNLCYWTDTVNVGDQISKPIVEWMLAQKGLTLDTPTDRTYHLMALGSIIGTAYFDAVIWGSGINTPIATYRTGWRRKHTKFDIRAVRGPLTHQVLESFNYDCSGCVYGDPGILMPLVYPSEVERGQHEVSVIKHFLTVPDKKEKSKKEPYNSINVATEDYKGFVDAIVSSNKVISSSLHGIILAESYGIPAVFLNENGKMDREIVKYYDWYYSTGRRSVSCAGTLEEAMKMEPMPIPDLEGMREKLIDKFPYDLWKK